MIAAALCAIVAGFGIFGIGNNTASATAAGDTSTGYAALGIEQLQKIVENLVQQIQQLRQMIAQLKPLETCGNGKCRFGETAATCAKDCGSSACGKEGDIADSFSSETSGTKPCCAGLEPLSYNIEVQQPNAEPLTVAKMTCAKCGNGVCSFGETAATCAKDCANVSTGCAKEGTACWATKCASNGNSSEVAKCGEGGSTCCSGLSCVSGKCVDSGDHTIAVQNVLPCANEGEIFSGNTKQCCNGLTKTTSNSQPSCQVGVVCNYATKYTCAKISLPTTAQCAAKCKTMGYANSNCKSYGGLIDPSGKETATSKCALNYTDAGTTGDCNGANITDGSQTCCCGNSNSENNGCVKEGKIIDWRISPVGKCCSGLTRILDCKSSTCSKSSNSICTYCGNGACGLGENKFNCPADCKTATCAMAGEIGQCCAGLSLITVHSDPSYHICANCGDGVCTKGETTINCSKDCGGCAKEGEVFTGTERQCCNGLEKALTAGQSACQVGAICANGSNYTCQKIETKASTPICSQNCKAKGYTGSYCNTYGNGPFIYGSSTPSPCASGWTNIGTTNDCNANNLSDAGRTCCCGTTVYPICGNGTCETGETANNCVADCAGNNGIPANNIPASQI